MTFSITQIVFAISVASSPTASLTQSADVLSSIDWPLNMAQIREKMKSLTAQGQEPMGVKAWINTQLLPQVTETAREMQAEVDRAEQGVTECKSFMWSAEKEAAHRQSILEKDESERFTCIAMEHRLHQAEEDSCGDMKFTSETVMKTVPTSLKSLTNRTVDEVERILRESQQFFSDFYPKMLEKQTGCSRATEAALNQHATCEADEEIIEQFYCTMKFGRDQACKEYAACYAEKTKSFDQIIADVKDLEVHTKDRFKKLTCFSNADGSEDVNCDTETVNVAQLAVSYPSKPSQQTCIHLMKTRRAYTDVTCKEGSVVPHGDGATDAPVDSNSTEASAASNTTEASAASNSSLLEHEPGHR